VPAFEMPPRLPALSASSVGMMPIEKMAFLNDINKTTRAPSNRFASAGKKAPVSFANC
jgi:hypothetical protein